MDAERWRRVEEIFHRISELSETERLAALDEACGRETSMRREVESLLNAHEQVEDHLEQAVEGVFSLAASESSDGPERQRIGPYRVLRELGQGGLSTVFLGQRDDEDFPLKVAIKVVKRGMDTRDILRRLRQERRILASLDHPNIARLMDGGSTDDGLPYFVLEYIEGQTLDAYCDGHGLDIDARLDLFRQVCAAAHYAHQSLIVHRDIKPGNVMVTHDGIPKLLDFGIAKLMTPEGDDTPPVAAATATAAGLRLFTPEYASPEQVRGEPLTTASDIYSLGVLLYRLLTGVSPYEVNRTSWSDLERVICEQEPERPSTAVQSRRDAMEAWRVATGGSEDGAPVPAKQVEMPQHSSPRLARRLRGDLDNIVLMALRKEPSRRYASAQQLADDLERYRDGLPVLARRDTLGYRTGKFVRRNRLGVLAASLLLLSLLSGLLATTHQARIAQQERERAESNLAVAETQQAKAEQVTDFLIGIFKISDPGEARGNAITARELLDQGAARIADELQEEPEVQSAMMDTMGMVYRNLGLYPQAEPLLQQALEGRRGLFGADSLDVAETLDHLGTLKRLQGEFDASRQHFQEALRVRRNMLGEQHIEVADSLNNLAVLEDAQGHYDAAETLFQQALDTRLELLGNDHLDVAETYNNLAVINYRRQRFDEAERMFRRALDIRRRSYPNGIHPRIANTLSNLAVIYQQLGRLETSESTHLEVDVMRRQLLGDDHPEVGKNLNNLAQVRRSRGNLQGADQASRKAMIIFRRALETDHPNFMTLTYNRGEILLDLGNLQDAETMFVESLELRQRLLPDGHVRISFPLVQLGRLAYLQGNLSTAEQRLRRGIEIQEASLEAEDPDLAEARGWLALCLLSGHPAEAMRLLRLSDAVLNGRGELGQQVRQALDSSDTA